MLIILLNTQINIFIQTFETTGHI